MPSASQTAQDSAAASSVTGDGLPAGQKLTLEEMTRIMDVAATLRKERALVDQQLNIDQIKAKLRERLLEAAKVSGDPVTAAEIDAAIASYYDQLHEFREPPAGFQTFLAHLWCLRRSLFKWVLGLVGVGAAIVAFGMVRHSQTTSQVNNLYDQVAAAEKSLLARDDAGSLKGELASKLAAAREAVEARDVAALERINFELVTLQSQFLRANSLYEQAVAAEKSILAWESAASLKAEIESKLTAAREAVDNRDVAALEQINSELAMLRGQLQQANSLYEQAVAAEKSILTWDAAAALSAELKSKLAAAREAMAARDIATLERIKSELATLQSEFASQYSVTIFSSPNERSATERLWTDENGTRTSGFFVLVNARDDEGQTVEVPIHNRETDRALRVSRWGEQVPEAVFERLAADKKADGVLDEREFGVKRQGKRELEVTLKGEDGQPITRGGQITSW